MGFLDSRFLRFLVRPVKREKNMKKRGKPSMNFLLKITIDYFFYFVSLNKVYFGHIILIILLPINFK